MIKQTIFFLILLGGIFFSADAWAGDQQVSLAIDQTIFSLSAFPGEEIPLEINVNNLLDKEQLISLDFEDLSIEENNQLNLLVEKNELFGMKDWLIVQEKKIILTARENRKIDFKIKIPEDATVGSHYAGIFFRALPEIQGDNFQDVLVGAKIGSYVLLNVKGDVEGEGKINDFQAPVLAKEKNDLKVEFENLGNIHYIPHGEIRVKNIFSQNEEKIELEKHFVFPGKKYFFENNWEGGSSFGIYFAKAFFVDGNKTIHFSNRWILGKFSFLWLVLVLAIFFFFKKKGYRFFLKNKKNEK